MDARWTKTELSLQSDVMRAACHTTQQTYYIAMAHKRLSNAAKSRHRCAITNSLFVWHVLIVYA